MGAFRWPPRNERITNEYDNYDNPKDPKPKLDDWRHFQRTVLDHRVRPHFRSSLAQRLAGQFRSNMFAQVPRTERNVSAITAASMSRFPARLGSSRRPTFR